MAHHTTRHLALVWCSFWWLWRLCPAGCQGSELCQSRVKSGKTLAKARFDIDGQIVLCTWVWAAKDKPNHLTAGSLQSFPLDTWSFIVSSGEAKNRERLGGHSALTVVRNVSQVQPSPML